MSSGAYVSGVQSVESKTSLPRFRKYVGSVDNTCLLDGSIRFEWIGVQVDG